MLAGVDRTFSLRAASKPDFSQIFLRGQRASKYSVDGRSLCSRVYVVLFLLMYENVSNILGFSINYILLLLIIITFINILLFSSYKSFSNIPLGLETTCSLP